MIPELDDLKKRTAFRAGSLHLCPPGGPQPLDQVPHGRLLLGPRMNKGSLSWPAPAPGHVL